MIYILAFDVKYKVGPHKRYSAIFKKKMKFESANASVAVSSFRPGSKVVGLLVVLCIIIVLGRKLMLL